MVPLVSSDAARRFAYRPGVSRRERNAFDNNVLAPGAAKSNGFLSRVFRFVSMYRHVKKRREGRNPINELNKFYVILIRK